MAYISLILLFFALLEQLNNRVSAALICIAAGLFAIGDSIYNRKDDKHG